MNLFVLIIVEIKHNSKFNAILNSCSYHSLHILIETLDSFLNIYNTEIENLRKENRKQIEIIRGRFIFLIYQRFLTLLRIMTLSSVSSFNNLT